ncbi:MAG: family 10 glycosylhydrolase [Bacteroidales bacterium]|nr:family 10 glycosylhydrolase [Bacteroidales bacterium]
MRKLKKFAGITIIILSIIPFTLFSQSENREKNRAVWIHSSMFSQEKNEAMPQMQEMLDNYAEININNLYCFYSMMFQHQKEWDFLEVLLEEAHKRNIKVHSIFCPGQRVKIEGVIKENPEWLIRGMKGEIYPNLNIANPGVKKYLISQVSEALKYDIDGIHLDYIRFPVNQRFSYDKATCEAFKKEFGDSPLDVHQDCGSMVWCEWIKWNAEHVTTLVREIKKTIEQSGKNIVLGADVFPNHRSAEILIAQNWAQWAEEGIIDFVCPMLYTNDLELFRQYVKDAVKAANGKCLVYPGIACHSSHNKNTPEGVAQEVKISIETGADGVVFFSGSSLTEEFMDKLKEDIFK